MARYYTKRPYQDLIRRQPVIYRCQCGASTEYKTQALPTTQLCHRCPGVMLRQDQQPAPAPTPHASAGPAKNPAAYQMNLL